MKGSPATPKGKENSILAKDTMVARAGSLVAKARMAKAKAAILAKGCIGLMSQPQLRCSHPMPSGTTGGSITSDLWNPYLTRRRRIRRGQSTVNQVHLSRTCRMSMCSTRFKPLEVMNTTKTMSFHFLRVGLVPFYFLEMTCMPTVLAWFRRSLTSLSGMPHQTRARRSPMPT